jgi:WD40 repeat protein
MVRWSPGGDVYCLVDETKFTIYTADDNTVTHTIETPRKIVSLAFITVHSRRASKLIQNLNCEDPHLRSVCGIKKQPKLVALGCEEGFLQVWDIATGEMTHNLIGHKVRVRGLSVTHLPLVEDAVEGKQATSAFD